MQNPKNTLLSLGAAIATTKLAHLLSGLALNDVLRPVGLSRRRSQWPGHLAFLGAGIVVGGVTALLLAPSSGEQTRARVARKAGELGEVALKKARDMGEELRQEVSALTPHLGNGGSGSHPEQA
jgi:hypothetical protein